MKKTKNEELSEELIKKSIELKKRFDMVEKEIMRLRAYVLELKPKCLNFKIKSRVVLEEAFIRFENDTETILDLFPLMRDKFQSILILLDMKKNKAMDA